VEEEVEDAEGELELFESEDGSEVDKLRGFTEIEMVDDEEDELSTGEERSSRRLERKALEVVLEAAREEEPPRVSKLNDEASVSSYSKTKRNRTSTMSEIE
jgi:hypothetical protein